MVIGLLILTSIPVVTGIAQGVSAQKEQAQRKLDERRMEKFNISVFCNVKSSRTKEVHGGRLMLRDERVWVAQPAEKKGYPCEAFFIEYPDPERVPTPLGLLAKFRMIHPLLNWLYVDKDTMELKYGNRSQSIQHHVGHWDWTEDEQGITLEELELFTAVEIQDGQWQVYFDTDEDGLEGYVKKEWRKLPISIERLMLKK